MRNVICLSCLLLCVLTVDAKTFYDVEGESLHSLFREERAKYVIQYIHYFDDTLFVPHNCVLQFRGGGLCGPVVFDNTKLCGEVNLKGSSISGSLKNKIFDASWLCAMDGTTDDAKSINEMIVVCGKVYFPKGTYHLVSTFNSSGKIPKELETEVKAHICICKSNVYLYGESGATFLTETPMRSICVFSQPNQIDQSIRNIKIKGITFETLNDGIEFHEFMHVIKLIGVNGMVVEGCLFKDFWGDAICLSHYGDKPKTGERTRNQNVKIIDNNIIGGKYHNNRNGISVISGKDVLIKGNVISNTSRDDMPGGIDIEPNNSAFTIDNIRVENNILEGIEGSGGAICVVIFNEGPAHNISIIGNTIRKCKTGILLYIKTENTSDNFIIKDNFIASDTYPCRFTGSGSSKDWIISDNTFEYSCKQQIPGKIRVDNLVVKNNTK